MKLFDPIRVCGSLYVRLEKDTCVMSNFSEKLSLECLKYTVLLSSSVILDMWMAMSGDQVVSWSVAMKVCTNIHGAQRVNPIDFGDPLETLLLAPL